MTAPAQHYAISADGTRLGYWSSGSGADVLLVHGTTADHTRWDKVRPHLERTLTVHAVDRRGRGGSGDGDTYSIELEGSDIVAVAHAIRGPLHLLGHSYGALCAIEAAPRIRDLASLTLYEPPLPIGQEIVPAGIRSMIDRFIAEGDREAAVLTFFREIVRVPVSQLDMLRTQPAWPGRVAAAHTLSREIRLEADYKPDFDRLRNLTAPTLLLLGAESPPFFREAIRRLQDVIPDCRTVEMPGQRHVAMDVIPEEFARIITMHVQRSSGPG